MLSSSSTTNQVYPNRLRGRQIRLLQLSPGTDSDPIHISLSETTLYESLPFEALSYVWGDASVKKEIVCDRQCFLVTVNLYHALLRLRQPANSRLLWVDAICINQNDLEERSQQVQFMRDIFSTASRVVVYLGHGQEDIMSLGLSVAKIIYDSFGKLPNGSGRSVLGAIFRGERFHNNEKRMTIEEADAIVTQRYPGVSAWRALGHLYSREWFTRIWCVQEIRSAQYSTVLVGHECTSWRILGVCAAWVCCQEFARPVAMRKLLNSSSAGNSAGNCFVMAYWSGKKSDQSVTLLRFLDTFNHFQCSDPRDKVYALVGIVPPQDEVQSLITVGYKKSLAELCMEVSKSCMEGSVGLGVLSYATLEREAQESLGSPSWVANWTKAPPYTYLGDRNSSFNACGQHSMDVGFPTPNILAVRGIIFDEIAELAPILQRSTNEGFALINSGIITYLWDKATADETSSKEKVRELALTLTGGVDHENHPVELLDQDAQEQYHMSFHEYIAKVQSTTILAKKPKFPLDASSLTDSDLSSFSRTVSSHCTGRSIFQVTSGQIGLGPPLIVQGDIIVVFHGGIVPFVLRPLPCGDYILVGECYILGIMQGEAFDEAKLGRPVPEDRVFRLV